jgi:hypothetical protein
VQFHGWTSLNEDGRLECCKCRNYSIKKILQNNKDQKIVDEERESVKLSIVSAVQLSLALSYGRFFSGQLENNDCH